MKSNLILLSLFVLFLASCGNKPGSGGNSSSSAGIYSVSGTISGLTTAGLKLRNNGVDEITIAAGATHFQFPSLVTGSAGYNVSIWAQPAGASCSLNHYFAPGINGDVGDVTVSCLLTPAILSTGSFSMGTTNYVGVYLDWLGNDPSSYKVGFSVGSPPNEGGAIAGTSNSAYLPGVNAASIQGGMHPAYHFICPSGADNYSSTVCTNAVLVQ